MMNPLRFCLVGGHGEIATKAHRPALDIVDGVELAAIADPSSATDKSTIELPTFPSLKDAMAANENQTLFNAVAVCTPPSQTFAIALQALEAGYHTLVEKPPGGDPTVLLNVAQTKSASVLTAYHTAHCPAATIAQKFIQDHDITAIRIEWKESAHKWHPNQDWIRTMDGGGVLDMIFNPISLVTGPLSLTFWHFAWASRAGISRRQFSSAEYCGMLL